MRILIKNTRMVSPDVPTSQKAKSILVEDGIIAEIKAGIDPKVDHCISSENSYTSPGWVDVGAQIAEPGYEQREDIDSVTNAAAAGGFTSILSLPNTSPVVQTKSDLKYIFKKSEDKVCKIIPMAAISMNCQGEDMTEMYDLHHAGAIAFTDGLKGMQNSGLLKRALEYVQAFDGLLLVHPSDGNLTSGAQIHEGIVSTSLGMRGFPAVAEEMMVSRDLKLLEYTGGKLHFLNISTMQSVALIKNAKKQGLNVTCSVPVINLCFEDDALQTFDTNFKVMPPLRNALHRKALWKGLEDGTIDFVCSNHVPLESDHKELEFPYAKFGVTQLETSFALLNTLGLKKLSPEMIVKLFSTNARNVFKMEQPKLEIGANAELTVFDSEMTWTYKTQQILSKSKNNPMVNKALKGKAIATIRGNRIFAHKNIGN